MTEIDEDKVGNASQSPDDSVSETIGPEVNEKSLLRKIDRHLLPAVGILYLLSFLDRSNVGNARIEGLLDDLDMNPMQYCFKADEPEGLAPNPDDRVVHNEAGFLAARFFLGVAEAGLFPGVTYYFSMWYKRRERQYRVALFFSAASLAGAFGGALAYGIGRLRGVVWTNGWRWIFILEGIATVLIATGAYWFVHNYPDTSKFLNEDERKVIHQRLAADSDATHQEEFSWAAVREALQDPKCWLYGLGFHTMSLPLYTLSLFLPTIITNLGYKAATAQLLTVPPYAFAFGTTVAVAVLSERLGKRAIFIGGSAIFAAIGYSILLGNTDPVERPGVSYLAVFFAAGGIYPATALVLSWPTINVSGQTKRATATAMQISIGNLGAVLGTQLYRSHDGPRFIVGHSFALGYLLANAIVVTILAFVLKKENEQRELVADEIKDVGEVPDWRGDVDPRWRFEY
ncbi:hypothetical protein O1611_g3110 [Lasiodiplodia mahajangana]|uniref:Uncharacterized protein n=1 Tax=Lasiodiplodia mahajangana TaxID=1108764 RepID=A0ACC2JSN4_9PEZI|nr:hypothetical protein O1611_g3110 [Lasiodiplodia mahajangana]